MARAKYLRLSASGHAQRHAPAARRESRRPRDRRIRARAAWSADRAVPARHRRSPDGTSRRSAPAASRRNSGNSRAKSASLRRGEIIGAGERRIGRDAPLPPPACGTCRLSASRIARLVVPQRARRQRPRRGRTAAPRPAAPSPSRTSSSASRTCGNRCTCWWPSTKSGGWPNWLTNASSCVAISAASSRASSSPSRAAHHHLGQRDEMCRARRAEIRGSSA